MDQKIKQRDDNFTGKPKQPPQNAEWMSAQSLHAQVSNAMTVAVNQENERFWNGDISPRPGFPKDNFHVAALVLKLVPDQPVKAEYIHQFIELGQIHWLDQVTVGVAFVGFCFIRFGG